MKERVREIDRDRERMKGCKKERREERKERKREN